MCATGAVMGECRRSGSATSVPRIHFSQVASRMAAQFINEGANKLREEQNILIYSRCYLTNRRRLEKQVAAKRERAAPQESHRRAAVIAPRVGPARALRLNRTERASLQTRLKTARMQTPEVTKN